MSLFDSGSEPIILHRYTSGSGDYVRFSNLNAVELPPETPVARNKGLNTAKRNRREIKQQESSRAEARIAAGDAGASATWY